MFVVRWSCYHIISCNRPTCSRAIFADCIVKIQTLIPIHEKHLWQLYINITSTINIHRAAQPLPDRWRPMLVCMMKGYAPMLRYHNQLHQQLGHEMKPLLSSQNPQLSVATGHGRVPVEVAGLPALFSQRRRSAHCSRCATQDVLLTLFDIGVDIPIVCLPQSSAARLSAHHNLNAADTDRPQKERPTL